MPIYEFRCPACDQRKEVMLRMRDLEEPQFCDCGDQMDLVPSRPAWFKTGKYGKGGGNGSKE